MIITVLNYKIIINTHDGKLTCKDFIQVSSKRYITQIYISELQKNYKLHITSTYNLNISYLYHNVDMNNKSSH